MTTPATPDEAEKLATKAVSDYLNACRMDSAENLGNYLMKLASVVGVAMARAEGCDMAAARLMGTASFITQNMPQQPARITPLQ